MNKPQVEKNDQEEKPKQSSGLVRNIINRFSFDTPLVDSLVLECSRIRIRRGMKEDPLLALEKEDRK